MDNLDDTLRKMLMEYAEFCVKNEGIPPEKEISIVSNRLLKDKWTEIENAANEAGIQAEDLVTEVCSLKAQCRTSDASKLGGSEEFQRDVEKSLLLPSWKLERDPERDLDWKELAVNDQNFLRVALGEHDCEPEATEEIVSFVEQQTTPLRRKLEDEVGAAAFATELRLFKIFDSLNIRLEVLSENATTHRIIVPLYYVSCKNVGRSKISYELESEFKDTVDLSLRVFGLGLSAHLSYVVKGVSEFAAKAGKSWVSNAVVEVQFLPARLLWGNRCIGQGTYKSMFGKGDVQEKPLSPREWNEVRETLEPEQRGPSYDLTQASISTVKLITEICSVEKETTLSAELDPKMAGLKFGPKVVITRGRKVTVKYTLPGTHRYTLFTDKEWRAAWYDLG